VSDRQHKTGVTQHSELVSAKELLMVTLKLLELELEQESQLQIVELLKLLLLVLALPHHLLREEGLLKVSE
jgi:hypothetical protein